MRNYIYQTLYGVCVKSCGDKEKIRQACILQMLQTIDDRHKLRLISTSVWLIPRYKNWQTKSDMLSIKFSVRDITGFCKK